MAEKMRQPIEFFVPSNQPIKKLIRTMGRFISSYSTGKRLLIFPPHHPFPLPPHWMNTDTNSVISKRRIELDAILVSKATSLQTTHAIFTPYRALQYLLLTSSMSDVIALLSSSGSRRAAVYVSAAVEEFRKGVFSKSPYILWLLCYLLLLLFIIMLIILINFIIFLFSFFFFYLLIFPKY